MRKAGGTLHIVDAILKADHPLDDIDAFVQEQAALGDAAHYDDSLLKFRRRGAFPGRIIHVRLDYGRALAGTGGFSN